MKRKLFRKLTITFAMAMSLANLVANATEVAIYDVDSNGTISISDVVLLNRYIAEDLTTVYDGVSLNLNDINNDSMLTIEDSFELLAYIASMEAQTTTTETTTTTTGTTTTTTETTTTESTTASTTTETTTVTTSESTETSTTTIGENAHLELIQDLMLEMAEGIEIPALNDDTFTAGNGVFFFESEDGTIFAYQMLTKNPDAPAWFDMTPYYIDAIHVWKYEGDKDISFELPDATGLTFECNGETYHYRLKDVVYEVYIKGVAGDLLENDPSEAYTSEYDYDLDGKLTTEDIKTMLHFFGNNIVQLKRTDVAWIEYMESLLFCATTTPVVANNCVIHFGTDYTEYSFVCPPYYFDDTLVYNGFYQVMPDSYYATLSEEFGAPCTDGEEFILYNMVDSWTTWSSKSDIGSAYITPILESGEYLAERYDDPDF